MIDDLPSSIDIHHLMEQAKARRAAMKDEDRAAEDAEQRKSFVRGFTTPCEHGMLDFEQCAACRDLYKDITMTADTTWNLCGPKEGWKIKRYGAKVAVIDATGKVREAIAYDSESEARHAVETLVDAVHAGRWK